MKLKKTSKPGSKKMIASILKLNVSKSATVFNDSVSKTKCKLWQVLFKKCVFP